MDPKQNSGKLWLEFKQLINRVNVTYGQNCNKIKQNLLRANYNDGSEPTNISNSLESTYISKLVGYATGGSEVPRFLRYLEDKVVSLQVNMGHT